MRDHPLQEPAAGSVVELIRLGIGLGQQGKLDGAIAAFRRAVERDPINASALHNLGTALAQQGKLDEAIAHFRRALQIKPDYAAAHSNLGNALVEQDKLDEAVASCRRAVELNADIAVAHHNLGRALLAQANLNEALACFHKALALKPDFAAAHNNLGNVFRQQGKMDLAAACFQRALAIQPSDAEAQTNLAQLLKEQGHLHEAEHSFRAALRLDPRHAPAWAELASLRQGKLSDDELTALLGLASHAHLNDAKRTSVHFALAQVFDARQAYAAAAEHLGLAHGLALGKWRKRGYDPAQQARFVERVLATFTADFHARSSDWGVASERPIFIFGLPRSGTTLLEQILASHAQVFGAGELRLAGADFAMLTEKDAEQTPTFEAFAQLDAATVQRQADWHLARLRELNADAPRIVDKMPANYLYLGLLATLFPRAKFIHARRDLRDVALSCWLTNFDKVPWTNDFDDMATRFREYLRMMAHWRQVLPVPMLEVCYEETVHDLESVARRMVAWCGLEWEPACLAFHQTKRRVRTASLTQVRQPIHARSVGRWRHYEHLLTKLFAKLPLE